jgi:curli biogenesis system outer membrane secretion channel CsgG
MTTRHQMLHVATSLTLAVSCVIGPAVAEAQSTEKVRIAVMNFENNSTWSYWGDNLGKAAADELVTQLFQTGSYSIIERAQLNALLAEQDLGASGAVDSSTAARIGQLLGVQLVLTGSITQFSIERTSGGFRSLGVSVSRAESVLDVRLVNTTTGEIMLAESGEGRKTFGGGFFKGAGLERQFDAGVAQESLRPAIEQVTEKIARQSDRFASLKPVAPPAQIVGARDGSIYINQGENFGVQVGQRFEVVRVVDEIRDASGNVLDRITDTVGVLEVTRVLSQSAICSIVEGDASEGDTIQGL